MTIPSDDKKNKSRLVDQANTLYDEFVVVLEGHERFTELNDKIVKKLPTIQQLIAEHKNKPNDDKIYTEVMREKKLFNSLAEQQRQLVDAVIDRSKELRSAARTLGAFIQNKNISGSSLAKQLRVQNAEALVNNLIAEADGVIIYFKDFRASSAYRIQMRI